MGTRRRQLGMWCAGAVALAAAGAPGSERVLVMPDGSTRSVDFLGLDGASVRFEENGLVRTLPLDGLLGIAQSDATPYRPIPAPGAEASVRASVELVTGERYPGVLTPGSEETVTIDHELFGLLSLPIDRVALVRFGGFEGDVPPDPTGNDVVLLANGDASSGFVVALDEALEFEIGGSVRTLSLDVLAAVRLANPGDAPEGTIVWLDDGSIARVASIEPGGSGSRVLLRPALEGEAAGVRSFDIGAVLLDASRVRPLATLPAEVALPASRRWSAMPEATSVHADPLLFAPDLLVPGPMTISWEVPAGASRVAMEVELPPEMRAWGDCEVALSFETRRGVLEGPRVGVGRETPRVPLASDLPSGTRRLVLRLTEGAFGPAQDRVVLRRPILLMAPDAR